MLKWEEIRISAPQAISIALILLALYGIYFDLREKAKDALALAEANQRAMIELNVALRANGVLK